MNSPYIDGDGVPYVNSDGVIVLDPIVIYSNPPKPDPYTITIVDTAPVGYVNESIYLDQIDNFEAVLVDKLVGVGQDISNAIIIYADEIKKIFDGNSREKNLQIIAGDLSDPSTSIGIAAAAKDLSANIAKNVLDWANSSSSGVSISPNTAAKILTASSLAITSILETVEIGIAYSKGEDVTKQVVGGIAAVLGGVLGTVGAATLAGAIAPAAISLLGVSASVVGLAGFVAFSSWAASSFFEYFLELFYSTISDSANAESNFAGDDSANTLYAGRGDNILSGGPGNDLLYSASGNDRLIGGTGADLMAGGSGNDAYYVDNTDDRIYESTNGGIDRVASAISIDLEGRNGAYANVENVTLIGEATIANGSSADNSLIGNDLDNLLNGRDGNDTLNGGAGADSMLGGSGNDAYYVDDVNDVITEAANGGIDRVASSISIDLEGRNGAYANVDNVTLIGEANIAHGSGADNSLIGNDLDNLLNGRDGNDTLNGGSGADSMLGGSGNDAYYVDDVNDVITEAANGGIDRVASSISIDLEGRNGAYANVDNVTLIGEANIAHGSGADNSLIGNDLDNLLNGRDGNDTLNGGAGADSMLGGSGNDAYYVDDVNDVITEAANGGIDRVASGISIDLEGRNGAYANVDNVTLIGEATIAHGSGADNSLIGNDYDNLLNGRAGNDTLNGGAGADSMLGGSGNDAYYVDDVNDVITEAANGGIDRVASGISIDLEGRNGAYANVDNVTLIGEATIAHGSGADNSLIGNDYDNLLNGRDGNDTLNGGAGVDRMAGGSGNDVYYVDDGGDVTEESANGGSDLIYSSISLDMMGRNGAYANTERLALTGSGNINGYGTDDGNSLDGNSGANVLSGRGGNDNIDGKAGVDTLSGGEGADIFIFQNGFDKDVITDFNSGQSGEKIDLSGVSSITSYNDLKASHLKQAGSDAVIDDGSSNTIVLNSISINSLTADDFLF